LITEFPFSTTPANTWTPPSSWDFSSFESEDANNLLPIIANITKELLVFIKDETQNIKTLKKEDLSEDPGAVVPLFSFILRSLEEVHNDTSFQTDITLPRLIGLFPNPSLTWKFLHINYQTLASYIPKTKEEKRPLRPSYSDQLDLFHKVFDFSKLRIGR